jgi:enolase-phosphatase E1
VRDKPAAARVLAILLDIEGTTTPITFVTRVLFPFARKNLRSHLEQQAGSVEHESLLARLREEHGVDSHDHAGVPPWIEEPRAARVAAIAAYVEWLMDRDRKSGALKDLQGKIWESGYQSGELVGEVFPDVLPALRRWRTQGLAVGIFSSGSVWAQQLLFRHSSEGDLTTLVQWFFDTRMGPKVQAESYRRIASAIGCAPNGTLFLSDVARELDAARAAGMQVRLLTRPGNATPPEGHDYEAIASFDEIA